MINMVFNYTQVHKKFEMHITLGFRENSKHHKNGNTKLEAKSLRGVLRLSIEFI